MASPKSKKSGSKNVQKTKTQCWNRTKMILALSFLVALLAISSLYLKTFTESIGWAVVLEENQFDETKIKVSTVVGTVWKDEGKTEEIGNIYLFNDKESESKEVIFRLASVVDDLNFDDESSKNEQKLKIVVALDIDRNGSRLTSRQIDVCILDKEHLEICQTTPPNKIGIHKEVPLPKYLFSGKYHLSGKLELVAPNGSKWQLGYVECDVKL